jgi:hypothetical protein
VANHFGGLVVDTRKNAVHDYIMAEKNHRGDKKPFFHFELYTR